MHKLKHKDYAEPPRRLDEAASSERSRSGKLQVARSLRDVANLNTKHSGEARAGSPIRRLSDAASMFPSDVFDEHDAVAVKIRDCESDATSDLPVGHSGSSSHSTSSGPAVAASPLLTDRSAIVMALRDGGPDPYSPGRVLRSVESLAGVVAIDDSPLAHLLSIPALPSALVPTSVEATASRLWICEVCAERCVGDETARQHELEEVRKFYPHMLRAGIWPAYQPPKQSGGSSSTAAAGFPSLSPSRVDTATVSMVSRPHARDLDRAVDTLSGDGRARRPPAAAYHRGAARSSDVVDQASLQEYAPPVADASSEMPSTSMLHSLPEAATSGRMHTDDADESARGGRHSSATPVDISARLVLKALGGRIDMMPPTALAAAPGAAGSEANSLPLFHSCSDSSDPTGERVAVLGSTTSLKLPAESKAALPSVPVGALGGAGCASTPVTSSASGGAGNNTSSSSPATTTAGGRLYPEVRGDRVAVTMWPRGLLQESEVQFLTPEEVAAARKSMKEGMRLRWERENVLVNKCLYQGVRCLRARMEAWPQLQVAENERHAHAAVLKQKHTTKVDDVYESPSIDPSLSVPATAAAQTGKLAPASLLAAHAAASASDPARLSSASTMRSAVTAGTVVTAEPDDGLSSGSTGHSGSGHSGSFSSNSVDTSSGSGDERSAPSSGSDGEANEDESDNEESGVATLAAALPRRRGQRTKHAPLRPLQDEDDLRGVLGSSCHGMTTDTDGVLSLKSWGGIWQRAAKADLLGPSGRSLLMPHCMICTERSESSLLFASWDAAREHHQALHVSDGFKQPDRVCPDCGLQLHRKSRDQISLRLHRKSHVMEDLTHACRWCKRQCANAAELLRHITNRSCSSSGSCSRSAVGADVFTAVAAAGKEVPQCVICDVLFPTWKEAQQHQQAAHSAFAACAGAAAASCTTNVNTGLPLRCLDCGLCVTSTKALSQHRAAHTGVPVGAATHFHRCHDCDAFIALTRVARHRRLHLGRKTCVCPVATCNKAMSTVDAIVWHWLAHHHAWPCHRESETTRHRDCAREPSRQPVQSAATHDTSPPFRSQPRASMSLQSKPLYPEVRGGCVAVTTWPYGLDKPSVIEFLTPEEADTARNDISTSHDAALQQHWRDNNRLVDLSLEDGVERLRERMSKWPELQKVFDRR